jgi:uncharacterized protein
VRGVDHILHAGDICGPQVLRHLGEIARLDAVRGNNDRGAWANDLQVTSALEFGDIAIYMLHDLSQLDLDPAAADFKIVISGHSHRPSIETRDRVLYLNPGSAGPRRFNLPVSLATLEISGKKIHARLHTLNI